MPTQTLAIGIVLGVVVALALVILWMQLSAGRRQAAPESDPLYEISQTLERMQAQLQSVEAERQRMFGSLEQQIEALGKETVALSNAMRSPNARGRWGELTLRRVAELSGMIPFCDFEEQATGGQQRPDMIVRLPGGRTLAVDAKVPLSAYLDSEGAADAAAREAALIRHAQHVVRHVTALSARDYWAQFQPAPEMVVLFLAGDHFLSAAIQRQPDLLERALERKVLIATPLTLVSILKGVAYGWRQERLARHAEEIRRIGGEFHERLRNFAEIYRDAGRHLARAVDAFNRSAGSWDSRVLPSLRRMSELGVGGAQEPAPMQSVDSVPREPQIPGGGPSLAPLPSVSSRTSEPPAGGPI